MTNFKNYYNLKFRKDLIEFFSTIPDQSKFHEDRDQKLIYSVQHERLTPKKMHLDFLDKENKINFGIALYFTVLTDMVCYTHYKNHYKNFQELTRYPKLIGNCMSWCHYHLHPKDIFEAMNHGVNNRKENIYFGDKFCESIEIMENEILDFFNNHLKEINGRNFWDKCTVEFPFKT